MKPLVSVIIPLYNAEQYIAECLNSVSTQSYQPIEVIVVDDGSTDNSVYAASQLVRDNITILRQANSGASVARNTGLKAARGKYIQFMDADDLISKDKIAKQVAILEANEECLVVCDTAYFESGTDPRSAVPVTAWYSTGSDDPVNFLIKLYGGSLIGEGLGGMIQPNSWLTPASLIDKAGQWNEMRCPDDDGEFFCRVILAGKGVKYAPDVINYYRKFTHRQSLSGQRTLEACKNVLLATNLKARHLLAITNDANARLALSRLFWENAFTFYPLYPDLSAAAVKRAQELSPATGFEPYATGYKGMLSRLVGWRCLRYLEYFKAAWRFPTLNRRKHSNI